jgi:hypothetical protein
MKIAFEPMSFLMCDRRINMNFAFKNTYEMQYIVA